MTVSASSDDDSIVLTCGVSGDQVTIDDMLISDASGVQQIQFADGTTWSRGEIIAAELANASPGDDVLVGTDNPERFDGKGGNDIEIGHGGGDRRCAQVGSGACQ